MAKPTALTTAKRLTRDAAAFLMVSEQKMTVSEAARRSRLSKRQMLRRLKMIRLALGSPD